MRFGRQVGVLKPGRALKASKVGNAAPCRMEFAQALKARRSQGVVNLHVKEGRGRLCRNLHGQHAVRKPIGPARLLLRVVNEHVPTFKPC